MKRFIYLLAFIVCLIISVAVIGGCEYKNDIIPDYEYDKSYVSPEWSTVEYADFGISVDGNVNEEKWAASVPYSWYDEDTDVTVEIRSLFGDDGLYLSSKVNTKVAFYNRYRDFTANTGVDFYIAPAWSKDINGKSVEIRMNAGGEFRTTRGNDKENSLLKSVWIGQYVNFVGKTHAEGGLNSNTVTYFSGEVFIPWSEFGMTEKPAEMLVMSAYAHLRDGEYSTKRTRVMPAGGDQNNLATFFRMNENGYVGLSAFETANWGNNPNGLNMTAGWTVDETSGKIEQTVSGQQRIYAKKDAAKRYVMSATLKSEGALGGDKSPKAGLIMADNQESGLAAVFLNTKNPTKDSTEIYTVLRDADNGAWDWPSNTNNGVVTKMRDLKSSAAKIEILRDKTDFYVFVNDLFVVKRTIPTYTGNSVPGFITLGSNAEFTNITYSASDSDINAALARVYADTDEWSAFGNFTVSDGTLAINDEQRQINGELKNCVMQATSKAAFNGEFYATTGIDFSTSTAAIAAPSLAIKLVDESGNEIVKLRSLPSGDKLEITNTGASKTVTDDFALEIIRELTQDGAIYRFYANDSFVGEVESDYAGECRLAVTPNYYAGTITEPSARTASRYTVTAAQPQNGEITVSATSLMEKSTLDICVQAENDYFVSELIVNGVNRVNDLVDNTLVLHDIDSNVTVSAVILPILVPVSVSGNVTLSEDGYGSVEDVTAVATAPGMNNVEITVNQDGSYEVELISETNWTLSFALPRFITKTVALDLGAEDVSGNNVCLEFDNNPLVDGKTEVDDELFYIEAKKGTVGNDANGRADFWLHLGDDGIYFYISVSDADVTVAKTPADKKGDYIEIAVVPSDKAGLLVYGGEKVAITPTGRIFKAGITADHKWGNYSEVTALDDYKIFVSTAGSTLDNDTDTDVGYTIEAMIPYSAYGITAKPIEVRADVFKRQSATSGSTSRNDWAGADENCSLAYGVLNGSGFGWIDSAAKASDSRYNIDGDLSEYDFDNDAASIMLDGDDRGFHTVVYKGTDGLYIAFKAISTNFLSKPSTTKDGVTHFELNVSFEGTNRQMYFYYTAADTLGVVANKNNYAAVEYSVNVEQSGGLYTVTAEIFMPCAVDGITIKALSAYRTYDSSVTLEKLGTASWWRYNGVSDIKVVSNQWFVGDCYYSKTEPAS